MLCLVTRTQDKTITKIVNIFGNVAVFKYMDTILRNVNCINEKITSRLNSGNAYLPLISEPFVF
jgi:phage-related holin